METGEIPILPRGHHNLSRDEVRAAQRHRLLTGIVAVVAEKGYASATVGDVLKRVRISRETFYQHFTDKQDCFLAAFDEAADELIGSIRTALGPSGDPVLERLDRVLTAYLGTLATTPALARILLIDIYGAGPVAVTRRLAMQERFAVAIADVISEGQRWRGGMDPHFIGRAVIGAVGALVTAHVDAGEYEQLTELRQPILELAAALLD